MNWYDLIGFGPTGRGPLLLIALGVTLAVTLTALLIGAVLGAIAAAGKLSRYRSLQVAADVYTTIFRGVPELLIIYLVYFGGSQAVTALSQWFGASGFMGLPSFAAGAIAVGVISGSYQTEVFRSAYRAISPGEIEAARAIGMPSFMLFRRIIVPQILRFALPGLGNVLQLSLKDSALVSVTGLFEIMRTTQSAAGSTHQYFLFYIVGGILYLVLTSVADQVFGTAERRIAKTFRSSIGRG